MPNGNTSIRNLLTDPLDPLRGKIIEKQHYEAYTTMEGDTTVYNIDENFWKDKSLVKRTVKQKTNKQIYISKCIR